MAIKSVRGPVKIEASRDDEGHRSYSVWFKVEVDNASGIDDPSILIDAPGLPQVGDPYAFSWAVGSDPAALCTFETDVEAFEQESDKPIYYLVKKVFSTKPRRRCSDESIQNPLLEPPQISGSTVSKRKTILIDRDGLPYISSSGELLVGSDTEIDDDDWEINISFNTASLFLGIVNSLRQHVNDAPLWGLPAETIKFSRYSFERLVYGTCFVYYRHNMTFQIRDSWAHKLQDRATMKLLDGGDPTNPDHWVRAKDKTGENLPMLALDINGKPIVNTATQTPRVIVRNPYPKGNLLLLGIPAVL
ncbi:MAG: hypothetical protein KatS3mg087_1184 [Patescibacteria group bacterium]|nr:MAG: hypothetical protein KatS3mg087_1184 [Patescibacteria group bacterium]